MRTSIAKFLAFILIMIIPGMVYSARNPRPLGTDHRIRQVVYDRNEVYEVISTYGFQTTIEFSARENIEVVSVGDSIAWQVQAVGSRLFLKPVEMDARTNMTVITNKRVYYFNLNAIRSKKLGTVAYLIRFEYPGEFMDYRVTGLTRQGTFASTDPMEFNFDYKVKKGKKVGLINTFDNGQFTYFQFNDQSNLPVVLMVGEDKQETLVNYRIDGKYVVVEDIAQKFILRRGKTVAYVDNKAYEKNQKLMRPNLQSQYE